jgi:hypothetical protein
MDEFAAKKADVIHRNEGHYKTLGKNPHFVGTGWKLDMSDCDKTPPPAPAPIEPPPRQVEVQPPAPAPVVEPPREAAAPPRQPLVDVPPPVAERSPDLSCTFGNFPCDGGRLAVHYSYGNVIINGMNVGPGTAELMRDGRLRHHGDGEREWREFAGVPQAVAPQAFMPVPEVPIGHRRFPPMAYPQQLWHHRGEEWRRHREWEIQQQKLAMYGAGTYQTMY